MCQVCCWFSSGFRVALGWLSELWVSFGGLGQRPKTDPKRDQNSPSKSSTLRLATPKPPPQKKGGENKSTPVFSRKKMEQTKVHPFFPGGFRFKDAKTKKNCSGSDDRSLGIPSLQDPSDAVALGLREVQRFILDSVQKVVFVWFLLFIIVPQSKNLDSTSATCRNP